MLLPTFRGYGNQPICIASKIGWARASRLAAPHRGGPRAGAICGGGWNCRVTAGRAVILCRLALARDVDSSLFRQESAPCRALPTTAPLLSRALSFCCFPARRLCAAPVISRSLEKVAGLFLIDFGIKLVATR
jgi:hypothetical protein